MSRIYQNYEDMEEEFRYLVSQSRQLAGKDPFLVLEQYLNEPGSQEEYGVVRLTFSENDGYAQQEDEVTTSGTIIHNFFQQVVLVFSVEIIGRYSRDKMVQLKLWLDTMDGIGRLRESGFMLQEVSGLRALHELIPGGSEWERRSQMDVIVHAVIEQKPEFRTKTGQVEIASLDVNVPE